MVDSIHSCSSRYPQSSPPDETRPHPQPQGLPAEARAPVAPHSTTEVCAKICAVARGAVAVCRAPHASGVTTIAVPAVATVGTTTARWAVGVPRAAHPCVTLGVHKPSSTQSSASGPGPSSSSCSSCPGPSCSSGGPLLLRVASCSCSS